MKILAIDTATELCSAALSIDGEVQLEARLDPTGHSKTILDMVESLMQKADMHLSQLDLLATDIGPGSFTGMRIGLGVAQGLAYGADIPVAGVHSLAALAAGVHHKGAVLAAIDARMGEVYWGLYQPADAGVALIGELGLCRPEALVAQLPDVGSVVGVGSGWDSYTDELNRSLDVERWVAKQFPRADHIANLAALLPRSKALDASQLTPIYIRNDVAKVGTKNPLVRGPLVRG